MTARTLYVAVCGAGVATDEEVRRAEEVGRLLAGEGAVVVCGGVGGVMEAAARGAADEGGVSVGILPGADRSGQAESITYSVPTGMGEARNALVVRAADALIAIGGEFGTLSEIALALRAGKRVVGLGTWELHRGGRPVEGILAAADPEEAVELALGS